MASGKFTRALNHLFIASFLIILPWFHGATNLTVQLFAQVIVYAIFFLLLVAASVSTSKTETPVVITAIDIGVFLAVMLSAIGIVISVLPMYSLMTWIRFGAPVLFFILVRNGFKAEVAAKGLLGIVLVVGFIYGIYGLLQLRGIFPKGYWYEAHSLSSRYVNSGHFAGFLVMPFFSSIICLLLSRTFFTRALFLACALSLSIIIILTKSRTVWVSLSAGFFILLLMLNHAKPILRKYFFWMVIGGGAVALAACFSGILGAVVQRFLELKSMQFYSIHHRFLFWQGAFAAIINRPCGWGLGTFVHVFPHFRMHSDRFIVDYAHNEILQLGVDLGALGILGFIFLLTAYIRISWNAMLDAKYSYPYKVIIAGISSGILTLAIASQFDFPLRIYATAFFAMAFLGVQAGIMGGVSNTGTGTDLIEAGWWRNLFLDKKFFLAILTLICLLLSGFYLYAETFYQLGSKLEKNFSWDLAMEHYETASQYAPWAAEYDEAGGRLAEKRASLMMNQDDRQWWQRFALSFYISALHKNSFWPGSFYKAGLLSWDLGRKRPALEYLQAAHQRDPKNPLFMLEYGFRLLETGRNEEGMALLEASAKGGYYGPVALTQTQVLEKIYPYVSDPKQLRRVIYQGAYALHDFGVFLINKGHAKDGETVLKEAERLIRDINGYQFYLEHFGAADAQVYSKAGLYKQAAVIYEEAIKQSTNPAVYKGYFEEVLKNMRKDA